MSPTDLIARLEREADCDEFSAGDIEPHIQKCRDHGLSGEADHVEREVKRFRQHAADLRAAAAAVRLVGECREALIGWCSERKREQALASIADWEARNAKT